MNTVRHHIRNARILCTLACCLAALPVVPGVLKGDEERELVSAMISPAPRMKSTLKGRKAVARGTNSTPPPTPPMGAITPIARERKKRMSIHWSM